MARPKAFMIWGSNTGVGKTLVSAGLGRAVQRRAGLSALYLKPVQTGFPVDADGRLVAAASGGTHDLGEHAAVIDPTGLGSWPRVDRATPQSLSCRTLFAWSQPVSPHKAVDEEGRGVSDEHLIATVREELAGYVCNDGPALALVETAGGVASPAPSGTLQCDALAALDLPAVLVGDGRLGGISATVCAAESLAQRGQTVAAVVLLDGGLGNEDLLPPHVRVDPSLVHVLPPRPDGAPDDGEADDGEAGAVEAGAVDAALRRWLESSDGAFDALLEQLLRHGRPAHGGGETRAAADGGTTDAPPSMLEADKRLLWHPYTSATRPTRCLAVSRAKGVRLTLDSGQEVIDGMSSWWAAVHGYAVPELDAAATSQLGRMSHVMFGGLTHQPAVDLARTLVDVSPPSLSRVFLADSGSVSVEVAIKMALQCAG